LRARPNRAGGFEFSRSISQVANPSPGVRDGGSSVSQRCWVKRTGLVRLEFYPGKLGRIV